MRWVGWVFVLLLSVSITHAQSVSVPIPILPDGEIPALQTDRFPTYTALVSTIVPNADRIDIARRLFGYQAPQNRAGVEPLTLGTTREFNVIDTQTNTTSRITAELVSVGNYAYVWVEQPITLDVKAVDSFLLRFDTDIYPRVRELWGNEPNPGIDGESRLYILFTRFINPQVDGYFTSQHIYPVDISAGSNEHEMIIFNLNLFQNAIEGNRLLSRSAHEFQHMVRHNIDGNESAWVDEGFSVITETLLGFSSNVEMASAFLQAPDTQLNNWTNATRNYGASLMFMGYFYERFGLQGLQLVSAQPRDGLDGVDLALYELGYNGVDSFFADWVLANILQRPDIGLGYRDWSTWWGALPTATPLMVIDTLPFSISNQAPQYSTHYYDLVNLNGATQLHITLQKPAEASLLPDVPPRGQFYMYSNIGDESDTTLTRAFDLTGVSNVTLRYGVWHNLETSWDYAYVQVSTDGGQRWQILQTPRTTLDNPNQRAYGAGYTGNSLGWKGDRVDLTPFAGQQILVRFEMITDDAKTIPGIALDEIAIPEIGYLEDFEGGDGGWITSGWIRSDNRLPQRTWVQVVQYAGEQVFPTRYLAEESGDYTLALQPNVTRVVLAISPFAPVTTVPMGYELKVEGG